MKSSKPKAAFIATFFNEKDSILLFLESLFNQSKIPDQIILVDAFSNDGTYKIATKKVKEFIVKNNKVDVRIIKKKGNRSVGRNFAISKVNCEFVAVSDAGCILDKFWFEKITKPFEKKGISVSAGFYKPYSSNIFEKCLGVYTSVTEDKVTKDFLPSSRSVAFTIKAWEKVGGYPEEFDTCEDLVFARDLKKEGFGFKVVKDAIVIWPQRKNLIEAFRQFYEYARGDGQALYIRWQTPFLFIRMIVFSLLFLLGLFNYRIYYFLLLLLVAYIIWSIMKNYRYVGGVSPIVILPLLQFTSDMAVIIGMTIGLSDRAHNHYEKKR